MAKEITELISDFKELHPCAYKRIRDNAIDEFSEKLIYELKGDIFSDKEKFKYARKQQGQICVQNMTLKRAIKYVEAIAEQLKGGAE